MLAKAGVPTAAGVCGVCALGALIGAVNGSLVAYLRLPSIVVTLAMMIVLRDALRWITQGAWVQDLPAGFSVDGVVAGRVSVRRRVCWRPRSWPCSRGACATRRQGGCCMRPDRAATRRGLPASTPSLVTLCAFASLGALTGLAAMMNAMRFNQIPANAGLGLEMKVIAAVVVGGTAITGGRGTLAGTVLGVVLLGAIGPALTFLGVSAYWERAIQGAIILVAVAADALPRRTQRYAAQLRQARA